MVITAAFIIGGNIRENSDIVHRSSTDPDGIAEYVMLCFAVYSSEVTRASKDT